MKTGIGIRQPWYKPLIEQNTIEQIGFLEVHSENCFGDSLTRQSLRQLATKYPISLHGVGLSLGSADGLKQRHIAELKSLVDEFEPALVSEHLAWSAFSHQHVPDLLPLPMTNEVLELFVKHVDQLQHELKREILIENPSNYLAFKHTQMSEPEFLNQLNERTGCKLLLDVNNIYVSSENMGFKACDYIDQMNLDAVAQIHLAGHVRKQIGEQNVLIDSHNQPVCDAVWDLYQYTLNKGGDKNTLIEWDSDFPPLAEIITEAEKANTVRERLGVMV
jgi:uncharacterized protein